MPEFQHQGIKFYFEEAGTGPPVLLIPGWGTDLRSWNFLSLDLRDRHRVIRLDNRGVGRSDTPADGYRTNVMAEDALALLDHLRVTRATVVGHSLGGAIAQQLAWQHPERVERLLLACSFAISGVRTNLVLEAFHGLLQLEVDRSAQVRTLLPWLFSETFLSDSRKVEGMVDIYAIDPLRQSLAGNRGHLDAVLNHDSRGFLGKILCPTLVLAASQDLVAPPGAGRVLKEGIPGARWELLEGLAHSCMLEAPERFNLVVARFLSKT